MSRYDELQNELLESRDRLQRARKIGDVIRQAKLNGENLEGHIEAFWDAVRELKRAHVRR